MALVMPTLETPRLLVRPFALGDLETAHLVLDVELGYTLGEDPAQARAKREAWLAWSVLNYAALADLHQPPYGDRAVVLRGSSEVIGAAGLAPVLAPLGQLPSAGQDLAYPASRRFTAEIGLFWAISPRRQGQGYATEAGRALIEWSFAHLNLRRIVATTEHTNAASIGVMRKLGMRLDRNPLPEPPWFQVVGILDNE
jgi:RimJ/RimL family protein N-acetyltransferase